MKLIIKFFIFLFHLKSYSYAQFDPFTLLSIGGGLIGGITNLLDNSQDKQREAMLNVLKEQSGMVESDYKEALADLSRRSTMLRKQREGQIRSSNLARGINDPHATYSGESDIINAEDMGVGRLNEQKTQALQDIANKRLGVEAGYPETDKAAELVKGVFGGAGETINMLTAFDKLQNPDKYKTPDNQQNQNQPQDFSKFPELNEGKEFDFKIGQWIKKKKSADDLSFPMKLKDNTKSLFKDNNNFENMMDYPFNLNLNSNNYTPYLRLN